MHRHSTKTREHNINSFWGRDRSQHQKTSGDSIPSTLSKMASKKEEGVLIKADLKACFLDLRTCWKANLQQELQKATQKIQESLRVTEIIANCQTMTQEAKD